MKKITCTLLLGILFFNWIGFRLFSCYLENKANSNLEARIDNNDYDESQLLSIKMPISHLSYYNTSAEFERIDGQVEINGVQYKFVKRRILNDSLEFLCLPNQQMTALRNAKEEFFKLVNDLERSGQSKKSNPHASSSKNFLFEYYAVSDSFHLKKFSATFSRQSYPYAENLCSAYSRISEQPPDHC